ncbi:MAG: VWA domain-containing protein [Pseudomonadota bacterium]
MLDLADPAAWPPPPARPDPGSGQGGAGAEAWTMAVQAAAVSALVPGAVGGVVLAAGPGPARDAWIAALVACRTALAGEDAATRHRLPVGCPAERVSGGLDLAATLAAGRRIEAPGIVARAAGAILLAPAAEAMAPATAAALAAALEASPAPLVVAFDEGAADEGLAAALDDRLTLRLALGAVALGDLGAATAPSPAALKAAAGRIGRVTLDDTALAALAGLAAGMGLGSLRLLRGAAAVARALAALDGRLAVEEDDLAGAVRLVLAPRARCWPAPAEEAEDESPPEPPQDPPADSDEAPDPPEDDDETEPDPGELAERVLEAMAANLPEGQLAALAAAARAGRGKGGARQGARRRAAARGRPAGVRPGLPGGGRRLGLAETLAAAAPWQRLRGGGSGRLQVRRDDLRLRRLEAPAEALTVFVVDASGSAAMARLAEAKGAVEILLAEAYRRRDRVALVAFRGRGAELVLAPTRALARARRALAGLPGGGATPLASGLEAALALAAAARREGQAAQVVVLTDGRANIARDGQPGRAGARADAEAAARALAAEAGVLVVDTAARPSREARSLAEGSGARYIALPGADAGRIADAARALRGDGAPARQPGRR